MQQLSNEVYTRKTAVVERIVQFGTGNFLRAFVDWLIHEANLQQQQDLGIVIVQSTSGSTSEVINAQDGLYTLVTQGIQNGQQVNYEQVIESVTRSISLQNQYEEYMKLAVSEDLQYVVSNTTEAGIVYEQLPFDAQPSTNFVANVTHFLWKRYETFGADPSKGLIFLPCELIEQNGTALKNGIVSYANAWDLGQSFIDWVTGANTFCNTLVDRIVPGFPKSQYEELTLKLGYEDKLLVAAEPYYIWVIENEEALHSFPLVTNQFEVKLVDDLSYYRERKVKMLNGAHSALTPLAILLDTDTVGQVMEHSKLRPFVQRLLVQEVIPTINGDKEQLMTYQQAILERFENPFIAHYVKSIALNALAKFKTRNIPSLLAYYKQYATLPKHLTTALAAWIYLYQTPEVFSPQDAPEAIEQIKAKPLAGVLSNENLWGIDLTTIPQLEQFVGEAITAFKESQTAQFIAELEEEALGL